MLLKYNPTDEHIAMMALSPVDGATPTRELVQLLPGVNEISENDWKCMRPNIKAELDRGEITVLAQKVTDGKNKTVTAKDLKEMPVNVAVAYIKDCMNKETLDKWFREETRDEVLASITKRMDKLGFDKPDADTIESSSANPMSIDELDSNEN